MSGAGQDGDSTRGDDSPGGVPPVLNYREGEPASGVRAVLLAVLGFVIAAGVVFATVLTGLYVSLAPGATGGALAALIVIAVLAVVLPTVLVCSRTRSRGFLAGTMIGLGVAGLVVGACFMANS
jgi:hypothetical protein